MSAVEGADRWCMSDFCPDQSRGAHNHIEGQTVYRAVEGADTTAAEVGNCHACGHEGALRPSARYPERKVCVDMYDCFDRWQRLSPIERKFASRWSN